jgi:putative nucleotidyltransferase with HDIG domain
MSESTEPIRDKRVELILQQLEDLPTLPTVAVRVLEVTGREDAGARDVVKLIKADPSLCARILQLVRRADMGVAEVTDVDRAVVLLGFDAVRSAVLAISVFQTFQSQATVQNAQFVRDDFWKHCLAVACCAELLSAHVKGINPSDAFVCGLLHDLGKIALDCALPKSFNRVIEAVDLLRSNIADVERQVIGIDHMVVGKRLAERWNLPAVVRDCIWLHGQLPEALPPSVRSPKLVNLVSLANLLVREQHLGYSGNYQLLPRSTYFTALGINAEQVDDAMRKLVDNVEPRAEALGLGEASSTDLYQQALSQANKELGRVSTQLAAKNRKLAVRAKFFDALSGFQSELRPDAAPQLVLQAIGQTAVDVLGVQCVGVFSLAPGQQFAETMLFDEGGDAFETSLVDCPARPDARVAGDGPVMSAGAELEWLVSCISPRLPGDQRYWIALEADGVCVGGVVWGATVGEAQRLSGQTQELTAMSAGWSLALRTSQIREEARTLAEQLAEANRQLLSAQNELLRSKMVASVGEMAAGAAHEMNNPLAVISGRSQLLAAQLTDPKLKHAAELVYQQSHRLTDIITELMDFAKPQPPNLQEVDLADLIEHALHDAKMVVDPADRKFELTIGSVPNVRIDKSQVKAALTEVFDNALQATDPAAGRIDIHVNHDRYSGRVVLTITDNGCGMDEHTLKHAFDPFFSAKKAGRRRGMGLAKALRWVEASGGSIRLESRPDQGTRTIVLLPAVSEKQQVEPKQKKAAQ